MELQASTKERIFAAAVDLFSRNGYRGTSMRDLSRAVGIKESSLYNHYASKEALLQAILDYQAQGFKRAVENLPPVDNIPYAGVDPVQLWLLAIQQFVVDLPPYTAEIGRILTNEMYLEPLCRKFVREIMLPAQRQLTEHLLRGMHRRGVLPEMDFAAEAAVYVSLIQGIEMENRLDALEGVPPQMVMGTLLQRVALHLTRLAGAQTKPDTPKKRKQHPTKGEE